jgi:hypothetical protein
MDSLPPPVSPDPGYLRTRAAYHHLIHTLGKSLPPPSPDTPEARHRRDQAAITQIVNRHGNGTPDRRAKGTPYGSVSRGRGAVWSGRRRERNSASVSDQARFLKRQLSLPVSTMSQWWVRRSSRAVVILASPNTLGHSPKARLVVTITDACS